MNLNNETNSGHGAAPFIGFILSFCTYLAGVVNADKVFKDLQFTALVLSILCALITIFNFIRKEYRLYWLKRNESGEADKDNPNNFKLLDGLKPPKSNNDKPQWEE